MLIACGGFTLPPRAAARAGGDERNCNGVSSTPPCSIIPAAGDSGPGGGVSKSGEVIELRESRPPRPRSETGEPVGASHSGVRGAARNASFGSGVPPPLPPLVPLPLVLIRAD